MKDEYRKWENRVAAARKSARENLDRELAEINLKVISDFGEQPGYDEIEDDNLKSSILSKKRFAAMGDGAELEDEEGSD